MKTRLLNLWDRWRSSYWFVPTLTVSSAIVLAFAIPWIDMRFQEDMDRALSWIHLSHATVRLLLSTIIGAMCTIVGLVFSLTVLTLSIATSQFGPRLLRTFLASGATQFALGIFVATAIYSLLVLAMVGDEPDYTYEPFVSLGAALMAAVFCLAYLVFFIQSIAEMVQAPNVVYRVARDLDDSIERICPEELEPNAEKAASEPLPEAWYDRAITTIPSSKEGYLQGVDTQSLITLAHSANATLRLLVKPGQFVTHQTPVVEVRAEGDAPKDLPEALSDYFVVGTRRTPRQDVECALLELVEVAVRALSPGINDPFTAISCIDHLGASLGRLAGRKPRPSIHRDSVGAVRVLVPADGFSDLLDAGFNQIRQHARANPAILTRLLEALTAIARNASSEGDRAAILRQMDMIGRQASNSIQEPSDRSDIETRAEALKRALRGKT